MPTQETVIESYWTWCKRWGIPYPCRKKRQVTRWRYTFSVVHESCKVGYASLYGCEANREYHWSAACLGWFDVYHPGPIIKYFDHQLTDLGSCRETYSLPPGGNIP